MDPAIEEMLRYESPVQRGTFRIAAEPVRIGATTIEPGAQIWAMIGAANRDPGQFVAPDRFDITRSPNRHLAFGYGIHYCLGASLARTEARIGFERLFARLPDLFQIAPSPAPHPPRPDPEWRPHPMMRGLKALPVSW
jgi:cytochrome P450